MNTLETTLTSGVPLKLTAYGSAYYLLSTSAAVSVNIKTDRSSDVPHTAKTGLKFAKPFSEIMLTQSSGAAVDVVLLVSHPETGGEYVDNR